VGNSVKCACGSTATRELSVLAKFDRADAVAHTGGADNVNVTVSVCPACFAYERARLFVYFAEARECRLIVSRLRRE